MWLLLVTTIASVLVADAGYLYNPRNVQFNTYVANFQPIHHLQPKNTKVTRGIQQRSKPLTYSVRHGRAYSSPISRNYNNVAVHGHDNHLRPSAEQNIQSNVAGYVNQGFASYRQPNANYINNNAQTYVPNVSNGQSHQIYATPSVNVGTNIGYGSPAPQSGNNQYAGYAQVSHLPASASYSNNYFVKTPKASSVNSDHYGSYSQVPMQSASTANVVNGYPQTLVPARQNVVSYVPVAASPNVYNNGYAQAATYSGNAYIQAAHHHQEPVNNGYVQTAQANVALNNGYTQTAQSNVLSHSHIQTVQNHEDLHNENIQSVQNEQSVQHNVYAQNAQAGAVLNQGYSQNVNQEGLNNGYVQAAQHIQNEQIAHNNGYVNTVQANVVLDHRYPQNAQNHEDLNNGYAQSGQNVQNEQIAQNHGYVQTAQGNEVLNLGHSQIAHTNIHVSNVNSQITSPSVGANLVPVYGHSSQSNHDSNNAYSQASSLQSSTQNVGYNQLASSVSVNLNNGHDQNLISNAGTNLNAGYNPASISSADGVSNNLASSTSGSSSDNYKSLETSDPVHIDLNPIIVPSPDVTSNDNTLSTTFGDDLSTSISQKGHEVSAAASVSPVVHKHIYFHVPPPEIEEPARVLPVPTPPKKNYNIIFIKAPTQDSKTNMIRLQQELTERQNAAVEHKTLVYVLVKRPEDPKPVELPQPVTSRPEVFFVKYNGSPLEIASQVNQELEQTGTVKNIVPLDAGLVSDHK